MAAGCAGIRKFRKTGHFVHFGETGDEPDTLVFHFQHNNAKNGTIYDEFARDFGITPRGVCFQRAKSGCGLADYEVQTWYGRPALAKLLRDGQ